MSVNTVDSTPPPTRARGHRAADSGFTRVIVSLIPTAYQALRRASARELRLRPGPQPGTQAMNRAILMYDRLIHAIEQGDQIERVTVTGERHRINMQ